MRTFRTNIRGVVLWDTNVPATLNVATTVAGALNAPVASPEIAEHLLTAFGIRVLVDLRGKFSGKGVIPETSLASTGSSKCDAYLWAKVNYLDSGKCNPVVFGYLLDGSGRARGGTESLWPRDYIVGHRGFVLDLDPWDDEIPTDGGEICDMIDEEEAHRHHDNVG